ncbi:cysteine-rich venom protein triflin-like [Elgaria multicarinata webbii]|uniref:cysteine-rich venom protein triflin-like n=1 Tax=Elgaria multicarinata webbii TaxID=159646 RepID=UPI002FCCF7CD
MLLPISLLLLAAVLQLSLGQDSSEPLGEISEADQNGIINAHNEIRRGVLPTASNMLKMTWNQKVSENARNWAAKCQTKISPLENRILDGIYCGENFLKATHPLSWTKVIKVWHERRAYFKYGIGSIKGNHYSDPFTQLIWYNSYLTGCAVAHCPEHRTPFLYFCQYCPGGNIVEKLSRPYKQGPSCGDCPRNCEDKLCTNPCKYRDEIEGCDVLQNISSCDEALLIEKCKATCQCRTEIK